MRWLVRSICASVLLLAGYVLGSLHVELLNHVQADDPPADALPTPVRDRLREADRNLNEAMQLLQDEKRYVPAIQGLNAFATSVGGVDAVADLESGLGVDPETFAGLYAGQALAEVAQQLGRDAEGHMTYKNKIVRMYNPSRLKRLFTMRADLVPVGSPAPNAAAPAPKKQAAAEEKKPKDE
jgi:hypothetical protein